MASCWRGSGESTQVRLAQKKRNWLHGDTSTIHPRPRQRGTLTHMCHRHLHAIAGWLRLQIKKKIDNNKTSTTVAVVLSSSNGLDCVQNRSRVSELISIGGANPKSTTISIPSVYTRPQTRFNLDPESLERQTKVNYEKKKPAELGCVRALKRRWHHKSDRSVFSDCGTGVLIRQ